MLRTLGSIYCLLVFCHSCCCPWLVLQLLVLQNCYCCYCWWCCTRPFQHTDNSLPKPPISCLQPLLPLLLLLFLLLLLLLLLNRSPAPPCSCCLDSPLLLDHPNHTTLSFLQLLPPQNPKPFHHPHTLPAPGAPFSHTISRGMRKFWQDSSRQCQHGIRVRNNTGTEPF